MDTSILEKDLENITEETLNQLLCKFIIEPLKRSTKIKALISAARQIEELK